MILILESHQGLRQMRILNILGSMEEVTLFEEQSFSNLPSLPCPYIRNQNPYSCCQLAKWIFFLTLGN